MQALCLMLLPSYYAQNYAGIIGSILPPFFGQTRQLIPWITVHDTLSVDHCWQSIQWNKHISIGHTQLSIPWTIVHYPLSIALSLHLIPCMDYSP